MDWSEPAGVSWSYRSIKRSLKYYSNVAVQYLGRKNTLKTKFKYYLASGGGVVVVGGGGVVTHFLGNSQMKLWSELQVETYQYPSRSLCHQKCLICNQTWLWKEKITWRYQFEWVLFVWTWLSSAPICESDVFSRDPLKRVFDVLEADVDNFPSLGHDGGHLGLLISNKKKDKEGLHTLVTSRISPTCSKTYPW